MSPSPKFVFPSAEEADSVRAVFQRNGSHASEALSREEIAYFRDHLLLMRTRLLEEAERTAQGMGGEDAQGFPDPTDRGVLESERNLTLRIRDRERKLLGKIDEALERIEQGSFGKCEECSEPIGGERLRVRPVTTLCIRCKEEQEERERVARR